MTNLYDNVILGLWPIAGITSGAVTEDASTATINAALDHGVHWFDTAYSYGYDGESDKLLGKCLAGRKEPFFVIGKAGQHWTPEKQRVVDCAPATLLTHAIESLNRIGIDHFELFMQHAVDPKVDIRRSAEAMLEIKARGIAKRIGVCNINAEQLRLFCEVVQPEAVQVPLNMLQRDILLEIVPFCKTSGIAVHVYWVLMKGILAGKITREHHFEQGDSRPKYDIYQAEKRERTHQLVDRLSEIAVRNSITVAQLSIGWALSQPGITSALVGAKRPEQIVETMQSDALSQQVLKEVELACDDIANGD